MNQLVLVGRITKLDNNKIEIGVSRPFKNVDGIYETDFIEVELPNGISNNVNEYCMIGDVVGVKSRVETGNKIVAEKVTFLSSKKKEEE